VTEPIIPRIISVGTANPKDAYAQKDLLELFRVTDPAIRRFFESSHIEKRHLVLPTPNQDGSIPDEDGTALLAKHKRIGLEIGGEAIRTCLDALGVKPEEVDSLVVVSSTGFLCPTLSAHLVKEIGFRRDLQRADLVGMGCNAGMNGLQTAARFAQANPGKLALLLAVEVCSAAYVFDMRVNTGVVNSLFGDGAAAVLLTGNAESTYLDGPKVVDFESYLLSEAIEEMRFDMENGRFSFHLGRDIPYKIGETVEIPINALLSRAGLKRRDITHWLIHAGGKKVIDSIKYNLGLTRHDVRHTRSILRDYGNLSSASFIFSYRELTRENIVRDGDWGVSIAMGPGTSIETGLLRW
jgi:3,5-dihydroxyphenylacetyl-CoA synthase